jgi:hypothetical protein
VKKLTAKLPDHASKLAAEAKRRASSKSFRFAAIDFETQEGRTRICLSLLIAPIPSDIHQRRKYFRDPTGPITKANAVAPHQRVNLLLGQGHLRGVRAAGAKKSAHHGTLGRYRRFQGNGFREGRPDMREAVITFEHRLCPVCARRMKPCKVNVECEGRVFRCANCDLWQSEGHLPSIRDVARNAA